MHPFPRKVHSSPTGQQTDAFSKAGVVKENLYQDQASGKKDNRPGLESCLKALREGDTLIVWKLDRLGRDLRHLVNTVQDFSKRGIRTNLNAYVIN